MSAERRPESPFVTKHGVVPSPWIQGLPWLLRAPIIALYVDTLHPEDDFLSQLRKLVISVGFFMGFSVILTWVYNNFTVDGLSTAPQVLIRVVAPPLFIVVFMGAYAALRLTSISLDTVTAIYVYGLWASLVVTVISIPDFPVHDSVTVLAMLAQLLRAPCLPLALGLLTVTFVVAVVNETSYSRGAPEFPLWALEGAIMRGATSRLLQELISLTTIILGLGALQVQLMESDKLTRQALAASTAAQDVAQRLGRYDTEGAEAVLMSSRAAGDAAEELLNALSVLVANLNKYRPHLPNWLLPSDVTSDDDVGLGERQLDNSSRRSERSRRRSSNNNMGDPGFDTASTRSDMSHRPKPTSVAVRYAANTNEDTWLRGGQPFPSDVSMAYLHFTQKDHSGDAVSAFVDVVHRLAAQSHAAVHSFIGDTVVLSWNAASRAVQSEAKAARMMAKLKQPDSGALPMWGFITTGAATVQLAGGARQQQVLTVSAPWLAARQAAMQQLSRSSKHILIDGATRARSEFAVRTRPFAVKSVAQQGLIDAESRLATYQLLGERSETTGEEWMYVLEKQEEDAEADVEQLFDAWQSGNDTKTLQLLATRYDSDRADVSLPLEERINGVLFAQRSTL